jgi:hypothetical protein
MNPGDTRQQFGFRLRSLFIATGVLCVVLGITYRALHFDDPFAKLAISADTTIVFTQEIVLELSAAALRQAGLEPLNPQPYKHDEHDVERFMGRNGMRPSDSASVIWNVRGGSYPSYTVRLERGSSQITATISENWL